jgi:transcriptional regulator
MYVPDEFKIDDVKKVLDFVNKNNFGILLSVYKGEIENTQIPLLLDNSGNNVILKGHMARANLQWYHSRNRNVTALFTGPHHYISPLWYKDRDSVPTWDYMAARLDGVLEVMTPEETEEFLLELSKFFDQEWAAQGNEKRKYYAEMVKRIVAFRIKINKITCKYKLSQNRQEDMENIIINLEKIGDNDAKLVANYMKNEMVK